MGRRGEAAFLFAFSAVAYVTLHRYSQTTLVPALKIQARLPPYHGADCLAIIPPGSRYSYLPPFLDRLLCFYNRVFQLIQHSEPAAIVGSQFARAYLIITAIVAYESFKQRSFLARRGLIILLIGQVATGGGTLPLYFGLVTFSRWTRKQAPINAAEVWSVFIATLVGYCLPSYYVGKTGWSYDALSLWQVYPTYISVLTTILPPLLRPFSRNTTPITPIVLIALLAVVISSVGHYQMLNSGVDFRDVARVFRQPDTLPSKVHKFFLMDFLFSVLATLAHVVLTFETATTEEWVGYALTAFMGSMIFGAGGGIALLWAFREILPLYEEKAKLKKVD